MTTFYNGTTKCLSCQCVIADHADRKCLYGPGFLSLPERSALVVIECDNPRIGYCWHGYQDRYSIEFDETWWSRFPGRTVVPLKCSAGCDAVYWAVRDLKGDPHVR